MGKFSNKGRKIVLIGRTEFWNGRKSNTDFSLIKGRSVINLVDKSMDVGDMVALFSLMDYIIAPDSAAIHIAGALKIPCIALFGNIDPYLRTHYYPTVLNMYAKGELECIPCYDFSNPCNHYKDMPITKQPLGGKCMWLLTPERIFEAGKEWFK